MPAKRGAPRCATRGRANTPAKPGGSPRAADPYDNPEGMTLRDRCLYFGAVTVPIQPTVYNNMKTIVQSEDHVLILIEWMHWPRHRPHRLRAPPA